MSFPSPIAEMARALRGPGPRSSLDQHVAAVLATVQISSLDTNLQLSGLDALSQAVEEVTERDHPLVRPDRSLRLAVLQREGFGWQLSYEKPFGEGRGMKSRGRKAGAEDGRARISGLGRGVQCSLNTPVNAHVYSH